jgi:hypothetical protein
MMNATEKTMETLSGLTLAIEDDLQEGILSTVQIAEKHGVATFIVNLILEEMSEDQAQFDHQQPIEEIRMDEANRELRELAEAQAEQEAAQAYGEYMDAMLHAFYEECFPGTEWDL